jgi:hypothetical protein
VSGAKTDPINRRAAAEDLHAIQLAAVDQHQREQAYCRRADQPTAAGEPYAIAKFVLSGRGPSALA